MNAYSIANGLVGTGIEVHHNRTDGHFIQLGWGVTNSGIMATREMDGTEKRVPLHPKTPPNVVRIGSFPRGIIRSALLSEMAPCEVSSCKISPAFRDDRLLFLKKSAYKLNSDKDVEHALVLLLAIIEPDESGLAERTAQLQKEGLETVSLGYRRSVSGPIFADRLCIIRDGTSLPLRMKTTFNQEQELTFLITCRSQEYRDKIYLDVMCSKAS